MRRILRGMQLGQTWNTEMNFRCKLIGKRHMFGGNVLGNVASCWQHRAHAQNFPHS